MTDRRLDPKVCLMLVTPARRPEVKAEGQVRDRVRSVIWGRSRQIEHSDMRKLPNLWTSKNNKGVFREWCNKAGGINSLLPQHYNGWNFFGIIVQLRLCYFYAVVRLSFIFRSRSFSLGFASLIPTGAATSSPPATRAALLLWSWLLQQAGWCSLLLPRDKKQEKWMVLLDSRERIRTTNLLSVKKSWAGQAK